MRLTISTVSAGNAQILHIDVPRDITLQDLKALINAELPSVPSTSQHLYYNGRLLTDATRTLEQYNMKDDDMVAVHVAPSAAGPSAPRPQAQQQQQQNQPRYDIDALRLRFLGDPASQHSLMESTPSLFEALNDADRFREEFEKIQRESAEREREKQREIRMLNEDPFNIEAQRKIEELIRQEQVMENLQSAIEHNPEAFGRVTMLYIPVEVNGIAVKAFVDSGAQATIMSPSCAERCGIMRLVDTRYEGIARGVGTARILGRVHSAQIKIGRLHLACSFTVMEGKHVDLLLGLDMLRRHQATLDLKHNRLVIQDEEVPFLGESEIPKGLDDQAPEPTVEGPGGSSLGGRSGAVVEPPAPAIRDIPQSQPSGVKHDEGMVQQLQGLGFSRAEALQALDATNGDLDMAANLLFN